MLTNMEFVIIGRRSSMSLLVNKDNLFTISIANQYKRDEMYELEKMLLEDAENGHFNTSHRGTIRLNASQVKKLKEKGFQVDKHGGNNYIICW